MMIIRVLSAIFMFIGVYGITNLFIGKKRPIHIKKDVKIKNKNYVYYYLLPYTMIILWGLAPFRYSPQKYPSIYFYMACTFILIKVIEFFFITPKYTLK